MEPTNPHDGRYAPSPTGELHLGNLRTALAAWLFARSAGARFIVRVDDLDPDRVRVGMAERQLADLAALGIEWDGEPAVQTERMDRYEGALAELARRGLIYPCFCTRADIRAAASAPHGEQPELAYPGTCGRLTPQEQASRLDSGAAHCLRVRASGATCAIDDRLAGTTRIVVDDFVVRRKDGVPAYLLATTIDDEELGIGEVVRGTDLLTSAPRQAWLAQQLGMRVPTFAHVPLVVGADGARLAKRHGSVTLADLAVQGHSAGDVLAWLARSLGFDAATASTTATDLLDAFEPAQLPREPLVIESEFDGV